MCLFWARFTRPENCHGSAQAVLRTLPWSCLLSFSKLRVDMLVKDAFERYETEDRILTPASNEHWK